MLFLGEYTARQGYTYSPTNDLILNFKKPPDRRGRPEWRYKEQAIQRAATAFRRALGAEPPQMLFAPMPPSKARDDPLHDDRVARMLRSIWPDKTRRCARDHHSVGEHRCRPRQSGSTTPQQIEAGYRIDERLVTPRPAFIAVVDDVLTTGAHFRAARSVLAACFPAVQIVGLFIARRVPEVAPTR